MQRIPKLDTADASPEVVATLSSVKSKLGKVPNILTTMAQSPAVLDGYLGLSGALANGRFPPSFREQIALTVAGENACDYCASAHSAVGKMLGLTPEEIERNLAGQAEDTRTQAALDFARKVVAGRGRVDDTDIAAVKLTGFSDEEVVEIVGNVAVNLFTNYFNHIARTEIDFPVVEARKAA